MSGSPKKSIAEISREVDERLKADRKKKAEEEAKKRQKAEEAFRRQKAEQEAKQRKEEEERKTREQFLLRQSQLTETAKNLEKRVAGQSINLMKEDFDAIKRQCGELVKKLSEAGTLDKLNDSWKEYDKITNNLNTAIGKKQHDDEKKRRLAELENQRNSLIRIKGVLAELGNENSKKFDSEAAGKIASAVVDVEKAIDFGNPANVVSLLTNCERQVSKHIETVKHRVAQWQEKRNTAIHSLSEISAVIEGLKADPVVMRWKKKSVSDLFLKLKKGEEAVNSEQFDLPDSLLGEVRQKAEEIVKLSNAAQIKAEQRDYITDSIIKTLKGMGFNVQEPREEHPGHPASAKIFGAKTASGKNVFVSVPVEGEVMYDVSGYAKTTEAKIGGGRTAVCDEAEAVLMEMQNRLNEAFKVKMGEINWEGKDPNRSLRKADSLPAGDKKVKNRNR